MSRSLITAMATVALTFGAAATASAQIGSRIPEDQMVVRPPRLELAGPRFGVTAFTGEVADLRKSADLSPFMTQFGWQWETRIVAMEGGHQALLEWVALLGGVEQGETNFSLSFLAGMRLASGVEFGVGPNISMNPDHDETSQSMIVAGGATIPAGGLYLPLNVAVGIADGGPRFTLLMGWVVGT